MKCENIRELMSAYIDNEINEVDKAKLEKHIAQCPQCMEEYELLKDLVIECSQIDEVELPEDFREELHSRLLEAKSRKNKGIVDFIKKNKWKTATGAVAAVLIFAVSMNSLGMFKGGVPSTESPKGNAATNGPMLGFKQDPLALDQQRTMSSGQELAPEAPAPGFTNSMGDSRGAEARGLMAVVTTSQQDAKIIKNGSLALKVKDVQAIIQRIEDLVNQKGGRVDNSYIDHIAGMPAPVPVDGTDAKEMTVQVANITIKVPAAYFEEVFKQIGEMGLLLNQSTSTNDVTYQYTDTQARMDNLKVQEQHLQQIMTKAANVKEILEVEAELNRVRTDIDLLTRELKNWDQQVNYSSIYINLTEAKDAEFEKVDMSTTWQKAHNGFIGTINNLQKAMEWLAIFLVSALPYILILGVGSLLAALWIRKRKP
jgi:hypothetical protein